MRKDILNFLTCPSCKNKNLTFYGDTKLEDEIMHGEIKCSKCRNVYKIVDSILILLNRHNKREDSVSHKSSEYKDKQIEYYDEKCDEEFEINRPHNAGRLYQYLIGYKFNSAVKFLPLPIKKSTLLDVCCGSGMATEYYAKQGVKIFGIDISFAAVKRAKMRSEKYNFQADFFVGDTENLSFQDDSFDFACVHDGLHHLENPKSGFIELSRVARKGIFLIEPARAFLTRISVYLGISVDYEDAGNFVYRFTGKELKDWAGKLGYKHSKAVRYLMYYPHFPAKWFKIFDSKILLSIFIVLYNFINLIFGSLGNKILFIAWDKKNGGNI